jgi:hypothetical protein
LQPANLQLTLCTGVSLLYGSFLWEYFSRSL